MEKGTTLISTTNKDSVFSSEAFRYLTGRSVYIECVVRVCLMSSAEPDCLLCSNNVDRKRREVTVDGQSKDNVDRKRREVTVDGQ